MKTTEQHSLNELTTEVTAFPSFEKFAEAMDAGYIPSLTQGRGRSKATAKRNQLVAELADRLESLGWNVWRG